MPSPIRASWRLLAALALTPGMSAGQEAAGEWVLIQDGTEVMRLDLEVLSDRARGTVAGGGAVDSASGTIRGNQLELDVGHGDTHYRWSCTITGKSMTIVVQAPGAPAERATLTRRDHGWSTNTPLAEEWRARLTGHTIRATESLGGGRTGSMISESRLTFCPGGRMVGESESATSVYVPGMTSSGVSQHAGSGRWEVRTQGTTASLLLFEGDGSLAGQVGLTRSADDVVLLGGRGFLLERAPGKCA